MMIIITAMISTMLLLLRSDNDNDNEEEDDDIMIIVLGMIILINLFLVQEVQASHIVGGDLTYKHISGDSFELNLRIYRDKESSTPFDSTVYFFIYDEDITFLNHD